MTIPTIGATMSYSSPLSDIDLPSPTAVGFIEAQGFIPMFEAIDVMTKAARVELGGVAKLGGGLISVTVRGPLGDVLEALEIGEETLRALYGIEVRTIAFANPCAVVAALGDEPSLVVG